MADTKISALPAATTPLAGTEVVPLVQSSTTKNVSVANLTAGRDVAVKTLSAETTSSSAIVSAIRTGIAGLKVAADGSGPILYPVTVDQIQIYNAALTQRHFRLNTSTGDFYAQTGNLVIGTSGKGIDFSATSDATGMTSELLDDYEEGTWTPTINGSGVTGLSYTSSGTYRKIGDVVFLSLYIDVTAAPTAGTNLRITGMPFSANTSPTLDLYILTHGWKTTVTSSTHMSWSDANNVYFYGNSEINNVYNSYTNFIVGRISAQGFYLAA